MFRFFKKKKCLHLKNVRYKRYFSSDGTPMVETNCLDCGYYDNGHVYCNPEDWENRLVIIKNGERIHDETF